MWIKSTSVWRSSNSKGSSIVIALLAVASACGGQPNVIRLDESTVPTRVVDRGPYLLAVSDSSAVVRWTTHREVVGAIRFWVVEDTTRVVANERSRVHSFRLSGLKPASRITYQIQISAGEWSNTFTFQTFNTDISGDTLHLVAFGDSGAWSRGQFDIAKLLNEEDVELVLHVGDLAYPEASPEALSDKFFAVYRQLLTRAPIVAAPGNHDLSWRDGEAFIDAFDPPAGWSSGSPLYFAFTAGQTRFIGLHSAGGAPKGSLADTTSSQFRWLEAELRSASADARIDWVIVFLHHSIYSGASGFFGYGSHEALQAVLAPLFDRYRVDLVLSGHDHDYQRSKPIRAGQIASTGEGTVYVVTGGGGGLMSLHGVVEDAWFTDRAEKLFHYVKITIDDEELRLEAIDSQGRAFDAYAIQR